MSMSADPTLPTCVVHHDRETRLRCPRCQRPVCDVCLATAPGTALCQACRAELADAAPASTVGIGDDAAGASTVESTAATTGSTAGAPARRPAQASAPVTFGLLVVYVAVFAFGVLTGGVRSPIALVGAQINDLVVAGQWWRVLTATMLHAGITHLLFNGYALYVLGPTLEQRVGSAAFAALYLAAGLAGGIAFLLSAPGQIAVGASGAIFGLFGTWLAASWVNRDTPHGRAGLSQLGVLLAINLALPLFIPGIAWEAHVAGLVVGLVVGVAWATRARRSRGSREARQLARVWPPTLIAVVLLAGLLWYT